MKKIIFLVVAIIFFGTGCQNNEEHLQHVTDKLRWTIDSSSFVNSIKWLKESNASLKKSNDSLHKIIDHQGTNKKFSRKMENADDEYWEKTEKEISKEVMKKFN